MAHHVRLSELDVQLLERHYREDAEDDKGGRAERGRGRHDGRAVDGYGSARHASAPSRGERIIPRSLANSYGPTLTLTLTTPHPICSITHICYSRNGFLPPLFLNRASDW